MAINRAQLVRLCSLRGAVKLEKFGMKRSKNQKPARVIAALECGLTKHASHDEVIEALNKRIQDMSSDSTPTET